MSSQRNTSFSALIILATAIVQLSPLPALAADNGEILVKLREGGHFAAAVGRSIGHGVHVLGDGGVVRGDGKPKPGMAERLAQLRADPAVLYAEPNYLGYFADQPVPVDVPSDPEYSRQNWLEAVGARQAWAVATGKGVSVAVVDSGVDLTHPDLRDNLLGDGYSTGDGAAGAQDRIGHGSFVAGIVAARRGNGLAGSGLAPDAKILPVKISKGYAASFSAATLAQGIDYAVEQGAQVINLSLYLDSPSQTVGDAIQRAFDAGVIVVAAAGNEGGAVAYPASHTGVIALAGVSADGALLANSNTGPEIGLAAYGGGVTSILLRGGFGTNGTGTSFAAPMVAATAANLLQIDRRLDRQTLAMILRTNANPLQVSGSVEETVVPPFGILDAGKAVLAMLPELRPRLADGALQADYSLPPVAGPVDVYVSAATPFGEMVLRPEGSWVPLASGGPVPLAAGYCASGAAMGKLFGSAGIFPGIDFSGLPSGAYDFKIGLTVTGTNTLVGQILTSRVTHTH